MTRNSYQHRPPYIRATNFAGRVAGWAKQVSLDPDKLIETARRRTALSDFGSMDWQDGFAKLCASLQDQARLNLIGRVSARTHLLQLLHNRLQIQAQRNQCVATRRITAPVIISGLPRSGSTLLHGLLAQDPAIRVPRTWEVMLPCANPNRNQANDPQRIRRTERMLQWVHRLAPRFRAVHPMGAALPQECIAITAHQFASVEFHTTFNVPDYQSWLDSQDGHAAIGYHRQFLQHLQADGDDRCWVLKAPAHLYTLPALAETYPDARFVFTRREPVEVAASIASHGVILRSAFSDQVDVAAVADFWMHWWAEGWRRGRQFSADHCVLELHYENLVAEPIAAVRELYAGLERHLTDETEQRMRAFMSNHPQDQHGRHRYTLDEFGLDATAIRAGFGV